jgi:hypothetical protein
MTTITINGQAFQVVGVKLFTKDGKQRTELKLRKPSGKKLFFAVVYENGAVSSAVTL